MPWCPKCRNEYYKGFTKCADCGADLVEELPSIDSIIPKHGFLSEEDSRKMILAMDLMREEEKAKLLAEMGADEEPKLHSVPDSLKTEDEDDLYSFDEADIEVYANEEDYDEDGAGISDKTELPERPRVYQNYEERAVDNKSSAVSLIGVGFAGMAAVVLGAADILPLPIYGTNRFMVFGVMGFLFLVFIVMGFVSLKNAGIYARKASHEKELMEEIHKWCKENIVPELLDKTVFSDEEIQLSEEMKYFKRSEKIADLIKSHFLNVEEAFVSRMTDEIYGEFFPTLDDSEELDDLSETEKQ